MADMDLDALFDDALDDLEASSQWQQVGNKALNSSTDPNHTSTTTATQPPSNAQPNSDGKPSDTESKIADTHNATDSATTTDSTTATEESKTQYLDMIDEALQSVTESVQQSQNAQATNNSGDDNMMDFFNQLLGSLNDENGGGGDEQLDDVLKKMMSNFFTVDTIQEPIQIIAQKYPTWLESNRAKLSETELANHTEQCNLYLKANEMLKEKTPEMDKIMDILTQTFAHGSLPSEVMDGMMPEELAGFAQQLNQLEKNAEAAADTTTDTTTDTVANDSESKTNNESQATGPAATANGGSEDPMKMFQEFMQMMNTDEPQSTDNSNTDGTAPADGGTGNVAGGMPKLSPDEMKQFQELMKADGCLIM